MRPFCQTSKGKQNMRSIEPWEKQQWRLLCEIQWNLFHQLCSTLNPICWILFHREEIEKNKQHAMICWILVKTYHAWFHCKRNIHSHWSKCLCHGWNYARTILVFQEGFVLLFVIWGQNKLSRASDSWFSMIIFMLGLTCLFSPVNLASKWQLKSTVDYYPQGCIKILSLETIKAD